MQLVHSSLLFCVSAVRCWLAADCQKMSRTEVHWPSGVFLSHRRGSFLIVPGTLVVIYSIPLRGKGLIHWWYYFQNCTKIETLNMRRTFRHGKALSFLLSVKFNVELRSNIECRMASREQRILMPGLVNIDFTMKVSWLKFSHIT